MGTKKTQPKAMAETGVQFVCDYYKGTNAAKVWVSWDKNQMSVTKESWIIL